MLHWCPCLTSWIARGPCAPCAESSPRPSETQNHFLSAASRFRPFLGGCDLLNFLYADLSNACPGRPRPSHSAWLVDLASGFQRPSRHHARARARRLSRNGGFQVRQIAETSRSPAGDPLRGAMRGQDEEGINSFTNPHCSLPSFTRLPILTYLSGSVDFRMPWRHSRQVDGSLALRSPSRGVWPLRLGSRKLGRWRGGTRRRRRYRRGSRRPRRAAPSAMCSSKVSDLNLGNLGNLHALRQLGKAYHAWRRWAIAVQCSRVGVRLVTVLMVLLWVR